MALLPSFERLDGSFVMQRLLGYSVVVQPDEAVQRLLQIVRAGRTLTTRGCGQNLGLGYAAMPRLSRYSNGLREPRETLIRFSLYQRM